MRVMVVGSGGREHALVRALAASQGVTELYCTPGNAGIAEQATCLDSDNSSDALLELAQHYHIDLTVIGPEAPLVAGVVDAFEAQGLKVFGPSQAAAQLEGSKAFAKAFMAEEGIPTAAYQSFTDEARALQYLNQLEAPVVIKDSRLAAGKGVTIAQTIAEAKLAVQGIFAAPGAEVVIEAFLTGQELSFLVFTDGESYRPMLIAQDYKQVYDGDTGPMTGGMGTIAPVRLLSEAQYRYICEAIVEPTLNGLKRRGIIYKGVLYFGLMVSDAGIQVLEYNCRFGDPETQVVLPLLKTDLLEVMLAVVEGHLEELTLEWHEGAAACVVIAAPGYPGDYPRGIPISVGEWPPESWLIHAGTAHREGQLVSSGGRVLGVTARGESVAAAVAKAYDAVGCVRFEGAHFRRDIGARLKTRNDSQPG